MSNLNQALSYAERGCGGNAMMHSTHQFMGKTKAGAESTCAEEPDCTGGGWRLDVNGMASTCACEFGRWRRTSDAIGRSGIPREAFDWAPLSVPSERHQEVINAAESYVRAFNRREPVGIVMGGGTGRGKTRLMACIAAALVENGVSVQWHRWDDVLREIKATFGGVGTKTEADILSSMTMCSLLCLDDLGTEAIKEGSEWTMATLTAILDHSLRQGRPGIALTTNLTGKQIGERYGERVLGRILEATRRDRGGLVLRFDGLCDFRKEMHRKGVDAVGARDDKRASKATKGQSQNGKDAEGQGGCQTLELFGEGRTESDS